ERPPTTVTHCVVLSPPGPAGATQPVPGVGSTGAPPAVVLHAWKPHVGSCVWSYRSCTTTVRATATANVRYVQKMMPRAAAVRKQRRGGQGYSGGCLSAR